jgi:hypothetical protein
MKTEEQLREEWHRFFVKNKYRFTDDEEEAQKDKNKIYIGKELKRATSSDKFMLSEFQYRGTHLPFGVAINWKNGR